MYQDEVAENTTETKEEEKPIIRVKMIRTRKEDEGNDELGEIGYKLGSRANACVRKLDQDLTQLEEEEKILANTDLGEYGYYNGVKVPLDYPMSTEQLQEVKHQGKEVQLNKPKRGGTKKFYVYVRKPGGGIKKISFGDTTGLKAKINDPKARKSFAARHKCAQASDKTMASYWSCRLPRYAAMIGLKSNFTGFW
jgi:hypothetical protein